MFPIATVERVFEAVQRVKTAGPASCTNFFPDRRKVQTWLEHGELFGENGDGAAFFFRRDRDLWHFYFYATDGAILGRELGKVPELKRERMVTDLVGNEAAVGTLREALASAGFRPYAQLQRMARKSQENPTESAGTGAEITFAGKSEGVAILQLLDGAFDRNADQLPMAYEIEAAIDAHQILVVKSGGVLAALLHFETQGLTSTIRYWAVAETFRSKRFGSALIRRYFEMHSAVRRFILWVVAGNRNAVQKYEHYGYVADGLIDQVLVNEKIPG